MCVTRARRFTQICHLVMHLPVKILCQHLVRLLLGFWSTIWAADGQRRHITGYNGPPLNFIRATYAYFLRISRCYEHNLVFRMMLNQIETFSALLVHCEENPSVTGRLPSRRPVTQSFDAFFYLRLNKRLSKQSDADYLRHHRAHYDVIVMPHTLPNILRADFISAGVLECAKKLWCFRPIIMISYIC